MFTSHDIQIKSTTLARLIDIEQINLSSYGALILDTQGSELLVLKSASSILEKFRFVKTRFVKTEVADFDSYDGCCQFAEITDFLRQYGFRLSRKVPVAAQEGVGTYYDALYVRR